MSKGFYISYYCAFMNMMLAICESVRAREMSENSCGTLPGGAASPPGEKTTNQPGGQTIQV